MSVSIEPRCGRHRTPLRFSRRLRAWVCGQWTLRTPCADPISTDVLLAGMDAGSVRQEPTTSYGARVAAYVPAEVSSG